MAENSVTLGSVESVLVRARYLIGCQLSEGDFADEPSPTEAEMRQLLNSIEEMIDEINEKEPTNG